MESGGKKIGGMFILISIILTFIFPMEVTTDTKQDFEEYSIFDQVGIENYVDMIPIYIQKDVIEYRENNNLKFMDGLKNGYLVIASFYRDTIISIVCDYISGFDGKGIFSGIIWAIIGLVYVPIKCIILGLIGVCISIFQLLTQTASLTYYIGYILTLLASISIFGAISSKRD